LQITGSASLVAFGMLIPRQAEELNPQAEQY